MSARLPISASSEYKPSALQTGRMLPFEASDASGTDIPVPLGIAINRAGMLYSRISRNGDTAIYCAKGNGNRTECEVIKIQVLPAGQLGGRSYPVREAFPSSSQWGEAGWTFTNNSHRDPLAAAMTKAEQIAVHKKPHSASAEQEVEAV